MGTRRTKGPREIQHRPRLAWRESPTSGYPGRLYCTPTSAVRDRPRAARRRRSPGEDEGDDLRLRRRFRGSRQLHVTSPRPRVTSLSRAVGNRLWAVHVGAGAKAALMASSAGLALCGQVLVVRGGSRFLAASTASR